jgi:hypothetical protein
LGSIHNPDIRGMEDGRDIFPYISLILFQSHCLKILVSYDAITHQHDSFQENASVASIMTNIHVEFHRHYLCEFRHRSKAKRLELHAYKSGHV